MIENENIMISNCAVLENIHTLPTIEGIGISCGQG